MANLIADDDESGRKSVDLFFSPDDDDSELLATARDLDGDGGDGGSSEIPMQDMSAGFQQLPDRTASLEKHNAKLKERVIELKKRQHDMKAASKELLSKNHKLQIQIDELMEPAVEEKTDDFGGKLGNLQDAVAKRKAEAEEAKKRREEARKRRLAEGGGDDSFAFDDKIFDRGGGATLQAIYEQLNEFWIENYPLRLDVKYIEARYGSTLELYFAMLQMMTVSNGLLPLFWITLYAKHLIEGPTSVNDGVDPLTPGFSLNSSFTSSEATHFIVAIYLSISYLVYTATARYLGEDKASHSIQAFEEGENTDPKQLIALRLARNTLNIWEFGVADATEIDNQRSTVVGNLKVILAEDRLQDAVGKRTLEQTYVLWGRRTFGVFLNLVLIGFQWGAIGYLTIQQASLKESLDGTPLSGVKAFVVPGVISGINAALPMATTAITHFEQWDSKALELQIEVTRLYFCRILNAMLLAFAYYQLLEQRSIYQGTEIVAVEKWNSCYEDQTANEFLTLVLSDWVIPKVILFTSTYAFNWMGKYFAGEEEIFTGKFMKQPFALSSEIIQLMYSQILMWILIPYWPPIVFFIGFMHWCSFKFEAWMLLHYFEKPQGVDAKDTGRVISFLYIVTLFIALVTYVFYLSGPVTRVVNCSPFYVPQIGTNTSTVAANLAIAGKSTESIWVKIALNTYFLVGAIVVALTFISKAMNYHKKFVEYFDFKMIGYKRRTQELDVEMKKTKRELTLLKLQVNSSAPSNKDD